MEALFYPGSIFILAGFTVALTAGSRFILKWYLA
jgi:hypothetical protein